MPPTPPARSRHAPPGSAWALVLLATCSDGPEDCRTNPCVADRMVAAWQQDPETAALAVAALEDPVQQVAVIQVLAETYPGQTSGLCEVLSDRAAQKSCMSLNNRPHLRDPVPVPAEKAGAAADTSPLVLRPTTQWSDPYPQLHAQLTDCATELERNACQTRAAIGSAARGDERQAAALCAAASGKFGSECLFQASEKLIELKGAPAVPAAVRLCAATHTYIDECLGHMVMALARTAPPATSSDGAAWARVESAVRAAHDAVATQDPQLAGFVAERLWAEALLASYTAVTWVGGDPFDHLAQAQHAHVRAAAIARLWATDRRSHSLEQWGGWIEQALARRWEGPQPEPSGLRARPVFDMWEPTDQPWVAYLSMARRIQAETASTDNLVCLLEAAARGARPDRALLAEGAQHGDPAVRSTAERLLRVMDRQRARRR